MKGRLDMVTKILDDDNVDANLKSIAGSSALDIALACGMLEVARYLEEHTKERCTKSRGAHQS